MKVRQGFVSNSSSSSFVIIGVKFTEDDLEQYKENDYEDIDSTDEGLSLHVDDDFFIFGDSIARWSDSGECVALKAELPDVQEVYANIKKYFPKVKFEDVKLYCGTTYG